MTQNILLLQGFPASGKGTQAQILESNFALRHVSCGDILRRETQSNSTIGTRISACIKAGQLVPDRDVSAIILAHLKEYYQGSDLVIEGYPRTMSQLTDFFRYISEAKILLLGVIFLEVELSELSRRIAGRRVCSTCGRTFNVPLFAPQFANLCDVDGGTLIQRDDDRVDVASKRLAVYASAEASVKTKLESLGYVTSVDGNRPVHVVSKEILRKVQEYVNCGSGKGVARP